MEGSKTIAGVNPSQVCHETLLGKLLRLPFKLLPPNAQVRVLRGPARGKRWLASSSTRGFWLGFWELKNQRLLASRLRPGNVVYDIGAHVGLYTLVSSTIVGDEGHVYAFEPSPRNVQYLRQHVELNGLGNCTIVEAAVSDRSGWQHFNPTHHDTAGYICQTGAMTVRTVALDEFLWGEGERRPPNLIKIDAEGAELDVLRGGRRIVEEFSPMIFLSTHSDALDHQCREFLRAARYRLQRLAANEIWAEKTS
jgi:FkbM family methyltransferase